MSEVKKFKDSPKVKKKFKVPNTYTLIMLFVIIAAVMTYIVPAGEYSMVTDEITGKTLIDPTSFQFIDSNPTTLIGFLLSIVNGMNKSGTIIFLVFMIGGFFQIINDTGAIDAAIGTAVNKLEKKALLVIPVIMLLMTVLGALGIIVNAAIAFIPIGIVLARKLKLDPIVGAAVMYLGVYSGFASTPMGAFNTILGQTIAGIPPMSGFLLRAIVWAIIFGITVWYIMRYARKVKLDINNSVLDVIEWTDVEENVKAKKFTWNHGLILFTLFAGFTLYAYGSFVLKWNINYLSAIMLAVAIISGFIGKMSPDEMSISFINGCKSMVFGAMVIGFAKAITLILADGNVIHTLIYYMSAPLAEVGSTAAGVLMFYVNLIFNFFVPSGSGQAMIVMPLMAPMSDIVGVSRQIAVSAYQYGDGFSNTIIPTSGTLMAILGIAKIPYEKWLKFMLPLFGLWVLIATLALIVASLIGWS